MKRKDLLDKILEAGYSLKRNGGNHDIYGKGKYVVEVPRHREINERLAKKIIKDLGR